jgi:hypothetical protein
MISEDVQELLYKAIQIYDTLAEKDYLILASKSLQYPVEFFQIRIKKEYFWHLIGCKAKTDGNVLYDICKRRESIKQFFDYTRGNNSYTCHEKYNAFINVFDFVNKAKEIRICDTKDTPDKFNFVLALGNYKGIVGYDKYKNFKYFYPKSSQTKSIMDFNSKKTARKIIAILKKESKEYNYSDLIFEAKVNIIHDLNGHLDENYYKLINKKLFLKSD